MTDVVLTEAGDVVLVSDASPARPRAERPAADRRAGPPLLQRTASAMQVSWMEAAQSLRRDDLGGTMVEVFGCFGGFGWTWMWIWIWNDFGFLWVTVGLSWAFGWGRFDFFACLGLLEWRTPKLQVAQCTEASSRAPGTTWG